ncbi:hypothetical protein HON52_04465 [Candidatus Uhrbacteria bacterium]|jgi:hypothetical protein|nr:hypothetical protein [Candidatus Uhrbacteria bacterium]
MRRPDDTPLPNQSTFEKAVMGHGDCTYFGTMFTKSQAQAGKSVDRAYEAAATAAGMLTTDGRDEVDIPGDFFVGRCSAANENGHSWFTAHWFEYRLPLYGMMLTNPEYQATALLLAGYLQLGEGITGKKFAHYRVLEGLKFLPIVLSPSGIRFYMYRPTTESMRKAAIQFAEVLTRMRAHGFLSKEGLMNAFLSVHTILGIKRVQDLARNEVTAESIAAAIAALHTEFVESLGGMTGGSLGMVLRDVGHGPHDTKLFDAGKGKIRRS